MDAPVAIPNAHLADLFDADFKAGLLVLPPPAPWTDPPEQEVAYAASPETPRAAARGRHARKEAAEVVATPVIPDFAAEMFDGARGAVPEPRREVKGGGRHARSGR